MSLPITGKIRNYIFIVLLTVVAIGLIMGFSVAAAQDKAYRLNYQNYQQAGQLMKAGKYGEAQKLFASLDQDSQSSWQVVSNLAVCAQKTGDLKQAADFMQKAREIRPAFLMDQKFLETYGVILYEAGDYERARLYLQESLKYPGDAGMVQEANQYLVAIAAIQMKAR